MVVLIENMNDLLYQKLYLSPINKCFARQKKRPLVETTPIIIIIIIIIIISSSSSSSSITIIKGRNCLWKTFLRNLVLRFKTSKSTKIAEFIFGILSFTKSFNVYTHGTIIRTGITCKKIPL